MELAAFDAEFKEAIDEQKKEVQKVIYLLI